MAPLIFGHDATIGEAISTPPSAFDLFLDRLFQGLALAFAWLTIVLVLYIVWEIGGKAIPAVREYGLQFISSTTWDANKGVFGILPEIWGTLYSSVLALLIGGFFGVSIAIFLTQDFLPPQLEVIFKNIIELLAAIPSVVYGLWGIFVVIPTIRPPADWLHKNFGWIPLFNTSLNGPGMLPAALVLAIMILPTVAAIARDALSAVPPKIREAAFG